MRGVLRQTSQPRCRGLALGSRFRYASAPEAGNAWKRHAAPGRRLYKGPPVLTPVRSSQINQDASKHFHLLGSPSAAARRPQALANAKTNTDQVDAVRRNGTALDATTDRGADPAHTAAGQPGQHIGSIKIAYQPRAQAGAGHHHRMMRAARCCCPNLISPSPPRVFRTAGDVRLSHRRSGPKG